MHNLFFLCYKNKMSVHTGAMKIKEKWSVLAEISYDVLKDD